MDDFHTALDGSPSTTPVGGASHNVGLTVDFQDGHAIAAVIDGLTPRAPQIGRGPEPDADEHVPAPATMLPAAVLPRAARPDELDTASWTVAWR